MKLAMWLGLISPVVPNGAIVVREAVFWVVVLNRKETNSFVFMGAIVKVTGDKGKNSFRAFSVG